MKKYYYTPEAKFHQLRVRTSMLESTSIGGADDNDGLEAKGFGSIFIDEDEE